MVGMSTGLRSGNRGWASVGLAGLASYLLLEVLLRFLEPNYSILHNAESDYGVGPYGWVMDLNFVIRGVVGLSAVFILWRGADRSRAMRAGAVLVGAWGVASALLAFFPDDPPGHPVTTAGEVHLQLALVAFLAVAIGTVMVSLRLRWEPGLGAPAGALLALATAAIIPLLLLGHAGFRPRSLGGLYERAFLLLELLWFLGFLLQSLRPTPPLPEPVPT